MKSRKKWQRYGQELKLKVVEEYLSGGISKSSLCRKYSINSSSELSKWIRTFAPEQTTTLPLLMNQVNALRRQESEEVRELKRLLQQKELELSKERMRADFYETMVDVAEEQFNIPIRKKAGTKP